VVRYVPDNRRFNDVRIETHGRPRASLVQFARTTPVVNVLLWWWVKLLLSASRLQVEALEEITDGIAPALLR